MSWFVDLSSLFSESFWCYFCILIFVCVCKNMENISFFCSHFPLLRSHQTFPSYYLNLIVLSVIISCVFTFQCSNSPFVGVCEWRTSALAHCRCNIMEQKETSASLNISAQTHLWSGCLVSSAQQLATYMSVNILDIRTCHTQGQGMLGGKSPMTYFQWSPR